MAVKHIQDESRTHSRGVLLRCYGLRNPVPHERSGVAEGVCRAFYLCVFHVCRDVLRRSLESCDVSAPELKVMLDNRVIRSLLLAMFILACVVIVVLVVMAHNATVDGIMVREFAEWLRLTGG